MKQKCRETFFVKAYDKFMKLLTLNEIRYLYRHIIVIAYIYIYIYVRYQETS